MTDAAGPRPDANRHRLLRLLAAAGGVAVAVAGGTVALALVRGSSVPPVPTPTITSGPSTPTSSTSAAFTFVVQGASSDPDHDNDPGKDPVTFKCSLDGQTWASCVSPETYSGVSDGTHTFSVEAYQEGAPHSAAASWSWAVSTQAPTLKLTFPANGGQYGASKWAAGCATVGYCGSAKNPAGVAQVQLSILQLSSGQYWNGSSFSSASQVFATAALSSPNATATNWSYGFPIANFPSDGKYSVAVRGTDTLGHQTPPSKYVTATFTIDRVPPPPPTIVSGPANPTTSTTATFKFKDSQSDLTFYCSLDGSAYSVCSSPKTYNSLSAAPHEFRVIACDDAGNCSDPATYDWTVQTSAQTFGFSGNASGFLGPGAPALSINVIIANPFSTTLTVNGLTVSVTGTSNAGCGAGNFTVVQNLVGSASIPTNTTESLQAAGVPQSDWPEVQMIETGMNQDLCKGATVYLTYSGSGTHN